MVSTGHVIWVSDFNMFQPSSTFLNLLQPSSSFFCLLLPSSTFALPSSTFFNFLRPSSTFFNLLQPSCYYCYYTDSPTRPLGARQRLRFHREEPHQVAGVEGLEGGRRARQGHQGFVVLSRGCGHDGLGVPLVQLCGSHLGATHGSLASW